jgi:hypothetical protein
MIKGIAALLALTMLAASCSSSESSDSPQGFSCDNNKSKCPNDPPLPTEECKQSTGHPTCGKLVVDFFLCVGLHQTCLGDGTTDISVWMRECASQYAAVNQCFGASDAGGGG